MKVVNLVRFGLVFALATGSRAIHAKRFRHALPPPTRFFISKFLLKDCSLTRGRTMSLADSLDDFYIVRAQAKGFVNQRVDFLVDLADVGCDVIKPRVSRLTRKFS